MISDKRVAWKRSSDAGRATLHPVLSRAPGEEASSGQGQEGGQERKWVDTAGEASLAEETASANVLGCR